MALDIHRAAARAVTAVRDWSLGYGQGSGTGGRWDIRDGGAADCSSLVSWALNQGGITPPMPQSTYTGNLRRELVERGWSVLPGSTTPRLGDVLLWEGSHTALCVGPDTLAEAWINERGDITGGAPGDQTGQETRLVAASQHPDRYRWTHVLRPPTTPTPTPTQEGFLMALSSTQQQQVYDRVMSGIPGQKARSTQRALDDGDGNAIRKDIAASRPDAEFVTFTHKDSHGLANVATGTYRLTKDRAQLSRWLLPLTRGGWHVRSWKELGSAGTEVEDLTVFGTDVTPTQIGA